MTALLAEIFGYLAFIFLAVSLWLTNDMRFRWINSMGCTAFIIYGLLINAFPIVLTNAVLLAINVFFLFRIYNKQEKFDLVVFNADASLIPRFLAFYQKDIKSYFPDFSLTNNPREVKFVVLRDIVVANIFVAEVDEAGNAFVKINYTVPKYRDYKVGRFLFDEGKQFLAKQGIKKVVYDKVVNRNHQKFLEVIGFEQEKVGDSSMFVKNI